MKALIPQLNKTNCTGCNIQGESLNLRRITL